MRGHLPGLLSSHPIGASLPAIYLEDPFAQALCEGLDEVLAPVLATLDSLPAYFDPATAPDDLLGWLAGWLGLVVDDNQSPEQRRELVRIGIELVRWRGTERGVREAIKAAFQGEPEVQESGGAAWSANPGAPLPGGGEPRLLVRLGVADPESFDLRRLDDVVAAVKPAHLRHRVEVFAA
jgi:phage tail-like protein